MASASHVVDRLTIPRALRVLAVCTVAALVAFASGCTLWINADAGGIDGAAPLDAAHE